MMGRLLASNNDGQVELYCDHINLCAEELGRLWDQFCPTLLRMFPGSNEESVQRALYTTIALHDAGKLLNLWQYQLQKGAKNLPPHAAVGAAVLNESLRGHVDDYLRHAVVFAVAIHHIDRGTIGRNLDEPDAQAIRYGLVGDDGRLLWHPDAQSELDALANSLPMFSDVPSLTNIVLESLRGMASELRKWARGPSVRTMHQRRLQGSVIHHLLRVCDVRAAALRPTSKENEANRSEFSRMFLEGGLLWARLRT